MEGPEDAATPGAPGALGSARMPGHAPASGSEASAPPGAAVVGALGSAKMPGNAAVNGSQASTPPGEASAPPGAAAMGALGSARMPGNAAVNGSEASPPPGVATMGPLVPARMSGQAPVNGSLARVRRADHGVGNVSGNSSSRGGSRAGIELGQLLHAAALGEVSAIRGLLDEGVVEVNQADYDGRTALHLAASEGKVEAVRTLLERGADPNPKDRYGNTPLADAQAYGSAEICAILKEKGGMASEARTALPGKHPQIQGKEEFEIDLSDLDMSASTMLGRNINGDVKKASWKGTPVAVKVFQEDLGNDKAEREFRRELKMMQQLRHPNVVQFLGAVTRSTPHMLVTEYMPKGSLHQILKRKGSLPAEEALRYAQDIARGMSYLHQRKPEPIVHRDLSPFNLLRDEAGHLKVSDFGLSRARGGNKSMHFRDDSGHGSFAALLQLGGQENSYHYVAPEVFAGTQQKVYLPSVDVFSFGVILYEMFEGLIRPKYKTEEAAMLYADDKSRPVFHSTRYPDGMTQLISQCWAHDPDERPEFPEILEKLEEMVKPMGEGKPKGAAEGHPRCCAIL